MIHRLRQISIKLPTNSTLTGCYPNRSTQFFATQLGVYMSITLSIVIENFAAREKQNRLPQT
jgi:hypothetical protein